MCAKITLLILLIMVQISCAEIANKPFLIKENDIIKIKENKITKPSPKPDKILAQSKIEPTNGEKLVIFWGALVRVWADDEHGKVLSSQKGDLAYRLEAVSPQGLEQIENNQDIPESLINNFKAANKVPQKLLDDYPVKYEIFGYSGSRDMTKFYKEAKLKNPKTKAVVCFSNIGIDDSYTETLVYGEYYAPEKGLVKFYFQMKMELLEEKSNGNSFSGVENFNLIRVY